VTPRSPKLDPHPGRTGTTGLWTHLTSGTTPTRSIDRLECPARIRKCAITARRGSPRRPMGLVELEIRRAGWPLLGHALGPLQMRDAVAVAATGEVQPPSPSIATANSCALQSPRSRPCVEIVASDPDRARACLERSPPTPAATVCAPSLDRADEAGCRTPYPCSQMAVSSPRPNVPRLHVVVRDPVENGTRPS